MLTASSVFCRMTALAMASSTAIATVTSPDMFRIQKGYGFTTSSSRNFCSLATNSNRFSSPLSFRALSSHFLGRFELLSVASKVGHTNKTNALTEALKAVKAVNSVSSTMMENESVRKAVNSVSSTMTEIENVRKVVNSVSSTMTEIENVRNSVASNRPKEFRQERNHKHLISSASQRNPLDRYQILKYPLRSESAIKNIANNNTLVFVVDKRADKKNIRDAVEKMFKIQTRKVNTSIMPDGTKKAYLMLRPTDNASDIAKKIKVF